MGDSLEAAQQTSVDFEVHETGADQGKISLVEDGHVLEIPAASNEATGTLHTRWVSDGRRHWFRPQINGPDGKLWMIGNPIYINWGKAPTDSGQ